MPAVWFSPAIGRRITLILLIFVC
jgi:Protein of unknown function (DUF1345).